MNLCSLEEIFLFFFIHFCRKGHPGTNMEQLLIINILQLINAHIL
jgi:hypothetical protein